MLTLSVDLSGLAKKAELAQAKLVTIVNQAVYSSGQYAVSEAKKGPFKDRTRELRSTITMRVIGWRERANGRVLTVAIVAPQKYASYVEYGTRPHDIYPKAGYSYRGPLHPGQSRRARGKGPHEYIVGRGYALRWVDGSGQHFARMVHHPGSVPYPFIFPALERTVPYFVEQLQSGFVGLRSL